MLCKHRHVIGVTTKAALACIMGAGLCLSAHAAQWYWNPAISVVSHYNDNQTLAIDADDENSAFGNDAEASISVGVETPTARFRLTPRARIVRYTGDDDALDSEDIFAALFAEKRFETTSWRLAAEYSEETTLTSELARSEFEDPELDDPGQDETGLVDFSNTRERINVSPSFSATFNNKTGIRLAGRYTDISYAEPSPQFVDAENISVRGTIFRNLTNRTEVQFNAYARRFEAPNRDNETDSFGAEVRLIRDFDDQLQGIASIGVLQSDFEFTESGVAVNDSESGALFSFGLRRRFETGSWRTEISRTVNPGGAGFLTVRDQFRLQIDKNFSEVLTGAFIARAFNNESLDPNVTSINRDYFRIDAELGWRLSETLSLTGRYSFVFQEYEDNVDSAESNAIQLRLSYVGQRRSTSR